MDLESCKGSVKKKGGKKGRERILSHVIKLAKIE